VLLLQIYERENPITSAGTKHTLNQSRVKPVRPSTS